MNRKYLPTVYSVLALLISGHALAGENIIRAVAPISLSQVIETWTPTTPIYSAWLASNVNCGAWSPDPATITHGQPFTQSRTCDKSETRNAQNREISSTSGNYREVGAPYAESKVTPNGSTESQSSIGTLETWASTTPSYSEWLATNINCGAWSPDPTTITLGQSFTQTRTCDKSETRNVQNREISNPSGNYRNVGSPYPESKVTAGGSSESQDAIGTSAKLNGKYMFGTAFSGTSNAEGYTVSDNYHADVRGGWLAFDNDQKSMWYPESAYSTAYIQVTAPSPVVLRSVMTNYNFTGTALTTGYMATSITVKASTDGVNYVSLGSKSLTYSLDSGNYNSGVVSIPNSTAYRYYRISIAPTAHPYIGLQTLVLSSETNFQM